MLYKVDTLELQKTMLDNGYETIGEFAEAADLSFKTTADVVKGRVRPSTKVIDKMVVALKLEPQRAGAIFFAPNLRNT